MKRTPMLVSATAVMALLAFPSSASADDQVRPMPGSDRSMMGSAQTGAECPLSGVVDRTPERTILCTLTADGKLVWSKPMKAKWTTKASMSGGWARPAAVGATSTGYGVVRNDTGRTLNIVAACSPYASAIQLHAATKDDTGHKSMKEKIGGFRLPSGKSLVLKPGSKELKFIGLERPLRAGMQIPVTLTSSDGTRFDTLITVGSQPPKA